MKRGWTRWGGGNAILGIAVILTAVAAAADITGSTPATRSPLLNSDTLSWVSLSDAAVANQAVCNDGSTPGLWASLSTDDAAATGQTLSQWAATQSAAAAPPAWSRKWVLYIPSGGVCLDPYSCELRLVDFPDRVSSRNNSATIEGANLLSADPRTNPISFDHQRIYAHYCSSDFWLGREPGQNASGASPYAFQGMTIFRSMISDLLAASEATWLGSNATSFAAPSLADATEIILVGSSAGGIAAMNHVTWLRETVQAEQRARWNALSAAAILAGTPGPARLQLVQVRLVIDSGWFIDYESQLGEINRLGDLAWNLAGPSTAVGMPDPPACASEDHRVREVGVVSLTGERAFGGMCCFLANCMLNSGFIASDISILVVQSVFDTFLLALGESGKLGTLVPSLIPLAPEGMVTTTISTPAVEYAISVVQRMASYGAAYNASFQLQYAASQNVHFVLLACFNHVYLSHLVQHTVHTVGIINNVMDDLSWETVTVPRRLSIGANSSSEAASLRDIIAKWHNQTANSTTTGLVTASQEPLHYTDWCSTVQCNPTCPDYSKFEPSSLTEILTDTLPFPTEPSDHSLIEWACIIWIFLPALLQLIVWAHGRWIRRQDWRSMDVLAAESEERNRLLDGKSTDAHIAVVPHTNTTSTETLSKPDSGSVQLSFLGIHYWPQAIEGSSNAVSKKRSSSVVQQALPKALSVTEMTALSGAVSPLSPARSPNSVLSADAENQVLRISDSQTDLIGSDRAAFQTPIEAVAREEQDQARLTNAARPAKATKVASLAPVPERASFSAQPPVAIVTEEKIDLDRLRASSKLPSASFTALTKSLLKGVNGSFSSGQMVALMGKSGCGKTTLLELLACRRTFGMVHGSMLINGQPIGECMAWVKQNVGFVSQHGSSGLPELTVLDNLLAAARLRLPIQWTHHAKLARVQMVIDMCGLGPMKHTTVGSNEGETGGLSGGQRRRVALAIELLAAPRLLMLDEITSGLDASSALEILLVLHSIVKFTNLCCVLSIHQPRVESWGLFDQVLVLDGGHAIFQGAPFAALSEFTEGIHEASAWGLDPREANKLLKISESAKDNKTSPLDSVNNVNVADWLLDCMSFPAIARAMQQRYEREYRSNIVALIQKGIQEANAKPSGDKPASSMTVVTAPAVSLTVPQSFRRTVLTVATLESRRVQSMTIGRLGLNSLGYVLFGVIGPCAFFWRVSSALDTSTWFVLLTNCTNHLVCAATLLIFYHSMTLYLKEMTNGSVTATQYVVSLTLHVSTYAVLCSLLSWLPAFYFSSPLPVFDWGHFVTQVLLELLCMKCIISLFAITIWGLYGRMASAPLLTLGAFILSSCFIFSGFLVPHHLMPDSLIFLMVANPMYWAFGALVKIRLTELIIWGDQERYVTPASTGSSCAEGVSGWNCMMQQIPSFDTKGNSPTTLRLVLDTYGLTNIDAHSHMLILLAFSVGLTLLSWFMLATIWRVRTPVKCRLHEEQIALAAACREEQLVRRFEAQQQLQREREAELQKAQQVALSRMISVPPPLSPSSSNSRSLSGAARWSSIVRSRLSDGGASLVLELRHGADITHQPDAQFLVSYAKAQMLHKRQASAFNRKQSIARAASVQRMASSSVEWANRTLDSPHRPRVTRLPSGTGSMVSLFRMSSTSPVRDSATLGIVSPAVAWTPRYATADWSEGRAGTDAPAAGSGLLTPAGGAVPRASRVSSSSADSSRGSLRPPALIIPAPHTDTGVTPPPHPTPITFMPTDDAH